MSGSSRSLQSQGIWVTLIRHFRFRSNSVFHSVLKSNYLYSERHRHIVLLETLSLRIKNTHGFGFEYVGDDAQISHLPASYVNVQMLARITP